MTSERIHIIQRHLQQHRNTNFRLQSTTVNLETTVSPKFQYTLDNTKLTLEQRIFYEENGYVIIRKLIEDDLLDQFKKRFSDICEGRIDRGNVKLVKDLTLLKQGATGENLYYKLQECNSDPIFSKYFTHKKLLDYVECFTGPNIMAVIPMVINKPPDAGQLTTRHPVHQDLHAFPFRPANRSVGVWTAMEDRIDEKNGCLFVLPGTHRPGTLYEHDYPDWEGGVNALFYGVQQFEDAPRTLIVMEKGDTIFFHTLLLHGSGANYSKGFRKSISSHFASSECELIDMTGTPNEKYMNEVLDFYIKIKRIAPDTTYVDFWRERCSLIRGEKIRF